MKDSVKIEQVYYIRETVKNDVNLNDGKKDIEVAKINIKEVDTASEEYPNTKVEDENISCRKASYHYEGGDVKSTVEIELTFNLWVICYYLFTCSTNYIYHNCNYLLNLQ